MNDYGFTDGYNSIAERINNVMKAKHKASCAKGHAKRKSKKKNR